jgi:hypothetical protein
MPKPRKQPRSLTLLRLDRVSLVDKGDNPEAHILIHKRAEQVEKEIQRGRSMQRQCSDVEKAVQMKWGGEGWAYCKETYENAVVFEQGGKQWLAPYTIEDVEGEMKISLGDREEAETVYETKKGEQMTAEQIAEKFTALEGTLAETKKRAERAEGILKLNADERAVFEKLDAAGQDEYLAGDATVRAAKAASVKPAVTEPTDIEKRLAASEARNESLAKRVADAEERAELAEFSKRAEKELPNTPGTADEKGRMLRSVEKIADADARKAALAALKAGDAALAGIGKQIGAPGSVAESSDAYAKLEKAAEEIRKSEKVNEGRAWELAMERNPDLYREYRAEKRKGVN